MSQDTAVYDAASEFQDRASFSQKMQALLHKYPWLSSTMVLVVASVIFSFFNENFLIYTYLLFGVHNYNLEIFTHWLTLRILGHITFLCTQFTVFLDNGQLDILLLGVHY